MTVDDIRQQVQPLCAPFGVRRLDLFGSAAREEPDAADLDFLVEFEAPDEELARRFFGLLHSLEDSFGRPVDLLTVSGLRNPYVRARIMRERTPLYGG